MSVSLFKISVAKTVEKTHSRFAKALSDDMKSRTRSCCCLYLLWSKVVFALFLRDVLRRKSYTHKNEILTSQFKAGIYTPRRKLTLRIYNNIQDKVSRNIFSRSIWLLLVITVLSCFLILRYWAVKIASLPCASMWYNQFCYFVTRGRVEVVKSKISRQVKSIVESNRRVKETCKFEYPRLKFILKKTRAKRSLNGITTTRENHGNFRIPRNSRLP